MRTWTDAAPSESTSATPSQAVRSTVVCLSYDCVLFSCHGRSPQVPHKVSAISAPEELPEHVLFIGEKGELTVADKDLGSHHTQSPSDPSGRLLRAFVFGRRACSFVPARSAFKNGAVVVMVQSYADGTRISVFGAGTTETTTLAECPIPIPKLVSFKFMGGEHVHSGSPNYRTLLISPAVAPASSLYYVSTEKQSQALMC